MTSRPVRIGVQLQPQHADYRSIRRAVAEAEDLGTDILFNWDHFYPLSGDPDGLHYECWTMLAAWAEQTSRVEIGALVTCNSYRNPDLLADMARTVDHISAGRLILGIGAGWFQRDYDEYGYEFGTAPSRLKELGKSLPIIKARWEKLNPPPTREIPILIGGGGEKVTLKLTAQYANLWNGFGPPENWQHKNEILNNWCNEVGRDPAAIERTVSIQAKELGSQSAYVSAGAQHIILEMGAPFDVSPLKQLLAWRDAQG
jgi:probable F420-dependent oxidoreductase